MRILFFLSPILSLCFVNCGGFKTEEMSDAYASLGKQSNAFEFITARSIVLTKDEKLVYIADAGLTGLVRAELSTGLMVFASGPGVGSGPALLIPTAAALNADESVAYVTDSELNALVKVDLRTGSRSILSGVGVGTGPAFVNPVSIVINAAYTDAFIADTDIDAVLKVNLLTGDRTVISDPLVGTGPAINFPFCVTLSKDNLNAFISDSGRVIRVELATGNRTLIASNTLGTGLMLGILTGVALTADENTAFVVDTFPDNNDAPALVRIDILTGNRVYISHGALGTGQEFEVPEALALTRDGKSAYVLDSSFDTLVHVDLANGNRTIIIDTLSL